MFVPSSEVWKLALAVALGAAILMGAWGAAPRRSVPRTDLRRLVACALLLYGIGGLASDLAIVYGRFAFPRALAARLPSIATRWGNFRGRRGPGASFIQAPVFNKFLAEILFFAIPH